MSQPVEESQTGPSCTARTAAARQACPAITPAQQTHCAQILDHHDDQNCAATVRPKWTYRLWSARVVTMHCQESQGDASHSSSSYSDFKAVNACASREGQRQVLVRVYEGAGIAVLTKTPSSRTMVRTAWSMPVYFGASCPAAPALARLIGSSCTCTCGRRCQKIAPTQQHQKAGTGAITVCTAAVLWSHD